MILNGVVNGIPGVAPGAPFYWPPTRPGDYMTAFVTGATASSTQAVGFMACVPFHVSRPRPLRIDAMNADCTAAIASAVLRLGIYTAHPDTGRPFQLIIDAGTISGATTGAKTITLPRIIELPSGTYWIATLAEGASNATYRTATTYVGNIANPATPSSSAIGGVELAGVPTGALPSFAPAALAWGALAGHPRVLLREAA